MVSAREWRRVVAVTLVGLTTENSRRYGRTHQRGRSISFDTAALRVTRFRRRRIHMFEVLGLDQARRLVESGIPEERIHQRNPSPVLFSPGLRPSPPPMRCATDLGSSVLRLSGVAHDDDTFIEAYSEYFRQSFRRSFAGERCASPWNIVKLKWATAW